MAILRNTLIIALFFILGCSNSVPKNELVSFQKDGIISINRQAPAITSIETPNSLAFMPIQFDSYWLKIDSKDSKISLMQGSKQVETLDFSSSSALKYGSSKVMIKDNQPLWYASEEYYLNRKLNVPLAFSSERYLKGVYGEKALFLENGVAIYSNPEENQLVSGINVSTDILNAIYNNITVDSLVVIN